VARDTIQSRRIDYKEDFKTTPYSIFVIQRRTRRAGLSVNEINADRRDNRGKTQASKGRILHGFRPGDAHSLFKPTEVDRYR
jgi:hypothetical protein